MAATEYAPGQLVSVKWTDKDERDMAVVVAGSGTRDGLIGVKVPGYRDAMVFNVRDVRPLVVLDPADGVIVIKDWCPSGSNREGLLDLLREHYWTNLADQIEAQTKPPRIPEPTECGATVVAAQSGEIEGSDRLWVRFRHGTSDCWIDQYEHVRSWADLDNPRLEDCEDKS